MYTKLEAKTEQIVARIITWTINIAIVILCSLALLYIAVRFKFWPV